MIVSDKQQDIKTELACLMRPLSACTACRDRRRRCERPRQGSSCEYCIKKDIKCVVQVRSAAYPTEDSNYEALFDQHRLSSNAVSSGIIPDRSLSDELVELYFRYFDATFHSLFHRAAFVAAVRDGTVPKILFFGIASLSARFSSHPSLASISPYQRGRPYSREAERLLDFRNASVTTIQACMLLAASSVVEGEVATEAVFFSMACRLAMLINLPNIPAESRIEEETNIRVWWSLCMTDTWSSTVHRLPRAIEIRKDVPMPMDERAFMNLSPEDGANSHTAVDDAESSQSLLAQTIQLNLLLWEINQLLTRGADGHVTPSELRQSVQILSDSLDCWVSALPSNMRNTEQNLQFWADQNCGHVFITLHINYFHLGQILFYHYLYHGHDGSFDDPYDQAFSNAEKCKYYAASVCELIYSARSNVRTEVRYPLGCHVLVVASTVQLYTLLYGDDDEEISQAKSRLERNFEILDTLGYYWPTLINSLAKFKSFHSACLRNKEVSFRLDQWMLRFILEFAQPIEERVMDSKEAVPSEGAWAFTGTQISG